MRDAGPGSRLLAWMAAVLAATLSLGALMGLQGLGGSAAGTWPFAMIATLPLLGLRALLGRERRLWVAGAVGGAAGLVYGGMIQGLFTPVTWQPRREDDPFGLDFLAAGLVGGAVWWGVEWLGRETAKGAEP